MIFDSEKECENIINFVKDYYSKNNLKGAVIGISGGKDSAVVLAIFVKALGKENVVGVTMPCHSNPEDRADAEMLGKFYDIEMVNFDLTSTYDAFKGQLPDVGGSIDFSAISEDNLKNSDINIKPRLRMATLYYLAAMYSSIRGGTYLVAGTSNKSECFVGYFTKGGDSVHDIDVIKDFTVSEVIKIGEYLGVPEKVLYKAPSDGLSGQTDEDKLGVTYDAIEKYINGEDLDEETEKKISILHERSKHKFTIPTYTRKRIGIFVGSFDPVHKGHTHIINYLLENNYLDKVVVIPTGAYWDKSLSASLEDRINMLKYFENDKVEILTQYNNLEYTYMIFEELEKVYPASYLYLIIGADNIVEFDKWKNYEQLLKHKIIVVNRNNINIDEYIEKFDKRENLIVINNFDSIPISSTEIRQNVDSQDAKKYIDDRVYKYIKDNNLYQV